MNWSDPSVMQAHKYVSKDLVPESERGLVSSPLVTVYAPPGICATPLADLFLSSLFCRLPGRPQVS